MLEKQQTRLVKGLQELYRRTRDGRGWLGAPLKESGSGGSLTHDILERLGVLVQDGSSDIELLDDDLLDLNLTQHRLLASSVRSTQSQASSDVDSDTDYSAVSKAIPVKQREVSNGLILAKPSFPASSSSSPPSSSPPSSSPPSNSPPSHRGGETNWGKSKHYDPPLVAQPDMDADSLHYYTLTAPSRVPGDSIYWAQAPDLPVGVEAATQPQFINQVLMSSSPFLEVQDWSETTNRESMWALNYSDFNSIHYLL
jgi:hypothetical protein